MKKLFTENTETYNLSPLSYPFAYSMYKTARKNFWNPEEVNMGSDIASYRTLSLEEKEMFLDVFATLTTSDLVIQENIALRLYSILDIPEIRLWLGHQISDESLHSHTYQHCIEALGLGEDTIYKRYLTKEVIWNKFKLGETYAALLNSDNIDVKIASIAFYYLGWEGIWFYHGFTPILSLGKRGAIPGTISQLLYIARDEVTHVAFGVALLRTLQDEGFLTIPVKGYIKAAMLNLVRVETNFANEIIPNTINYNAEMHINHTKYMVNYRLSQIGMEPLYPEHTLPACTWLSEMLETKKERNFFETKVTEYRSASSLTWD